MFTVKAFVRGTFQHYGYEALWYSVDETAGTVSFESPREIHKAADESYRTLSLTDHSRIVVENSTGRTVANLYKEQGAVRGEGTALGERKAQRVA